ncbi:DNA-binding transcriptional LysR family regulator [Pelomonas saccharophila]|uniref:DNA-binding transcriptional LysR family regulator n=1 Tax=Roseateles saccharophilus TaxID=304 RepID=A0ABU1YQN2_ROSSA|nr:LysR family transcriptional regulator [Roseateles saccharophilus]MDR7270266.1 DNA-binding transcriptional LysR family regulator [Roseateles saccharophilus]
MASTLPWDLLHSFLGVLREGSLSGAARLLDLTQPTVGRHVAALEQALGQPLFTRSSTGLLPTEAALSLRVHAEQMEVAAAALQRAATARGDEVRGTVRVTASEVIGVEVLAGVFAALREAHPGLVLELALSNQLQDLLRREADIAVRMTPPEQGQLIARRIGSIELGLHARPDYLDRHGRPTSLADMAGHTLVGFDRVTPFTRAGVKRLGGITRDSFALRCDSDLAQLALIRAGGGIGACQVALARREPPLERVLADQFSWPLETWVAMHEDLRQNTPCRVVFDALVEGLSRYVGS